MYDFPYNIFLMLIQKEAPDNVHMHGKLLIIIGNRRNMELILIYQCYEYLDNALVLETFDTSLNCS